MVPSALKVNSSITFLISIIDSFNYTMDYMENVAQLPYP